MHPGEYVQRRKAIISVFGYVTVGRDIRKETKSCMEKREGNMCAVENGIQLLVY